MLAFASSSLVVLPLSLLATVLATASPASAQNPIRTQFQRSLTTTVSDVNGQTFDFVIAGGGTAGLALAARLSEWSNQTVCVIEAGGTGSDVTDQINIPGYSYLNGLTGKAQDWAYKTTPQNDANNSVKSWPRGKVLGGSGSTNGMFWVRASTEEYDAWNTLNTDTGAEDWGGEQMMKYINKAEKFTMPRDDQIKTFGMVGNASVHGSSGPIQASYCAYIYDAVKNWIPAWTALGFPNIDGHSGKKRGVTITPSIINPANSSRSNSLAGYIVPNDYRPNLVILTGYQVTKVNWNSTTQGEAVAGGLAFSAGDGQTVYNVKAAREVILSGGTVGSPQLLQLSGVGPAKTLSGLGITVVSDLPVGYNVQDHISVAVGYNVASGIEVWGELIDPATAAAALTKYKAGDYDNSQWSYVNEAIGYPSMADIDSDYATYASTAAAALNDNIADMTTWQTLPANVAAGLKAQYAITNNWLSKDVGQLEIILTMLSGTSGAGIQAALQHPYSRGTILINSTNAFDYPAIDPGYFGMGYDIDILNKGVEFARKLGGTAPLSDMLLTETTPGTTVTGDALNNWIRTSSGTEYHPLGSCSMLPQASGGVVDTKLLVYGTSNLRVVDASIIPLQLSAHLMATAYGIAEKGADIIKAANAAVIKPASSSVVVASSTKAASKVSASASASATPSGGISAGVVSDATSSGMSTSTRNTVIGVVVGVAGAALVGIIAFILARRRRADQQRAAARSYYASSPEDDAWESDHHTGYAKETTAAGAAAGGGSYAMAPSHSTSDLGLPPPPTVLPAHSRSMSVASYDTAEMSGAAPMEGSTGGWYQPDMGAPYQDDHSHGMSRSPSPAAQSHLYPDSNALRPQHYHQ